MIQATRSTAAATACLPDSMKEGKGWERGHEGCFIRGATLLNWSEPTRAAAAGD